MICPSGVISGSSFDTWITTLATHQPKVILITLSHPGAAGCRPAGCTVGSVKSTRFQCLGVQRDYFQGSTVNTAAVVVVVAAAVVVAVVVVVVGIPQEGGGVREQCDRLIAGSRLIRSRL